MASHLRFLGLAGAEPRIEDFLGDEPDRAPAELLRRLVVLDLAYRRRRGERPGADGYRQRFPQLDPAWLGRELARPSRPGGGEAAVSGSALTVADTAPVPLSGRVLCCPQCHNAIPLPPVRADAVCCPECGSAFRVEAGGLGTTTAEGRFLGRFELLERVGQGAFGAVWRARDTRLDRVVALKVPHPGLLGSEVYRERFRREARAAAQLSHPGIVRLYEVAELEPGPVLVSDFIEGVPLRELLESQRLTFREATALVAEVTEAADYAHGQGLVHRDIKPANILVEAPRPAAAGTLRGVGRPILVDFGLALRAEAEVVLTVEGQILGTPAYMSPEQAAGRASQVDRRSDVYSLGVVLYQLLCGELPFRGSKAMLLHQLLHEEPRPPRRLNDKIPRDLETVALKCLAKEPAGRYASAGDLAADLRRFLNGEPVRARPVGRAVRAARWVRRNPVLAGVSALAAAALAAVAVGAVLFALSEADHSRRLGEALQVSDGNRRRAEYRLAENDLDHALVEGTRGDDDLCLLWLARGLTVAPADAPELQHALRGNLAAGRPGLCPVRALLRHGNAVTATAFHPDGRTVVTAGRDGTVRFWETATGRPAGEPLVGAGTVSALAFRPDGRALLIGCADGTARLWDPTSRQPLGAPLPHGCWVYAVAFSPDGRTLATVGRDGTARLWEAGTGTCRAVLRQAHAIRAVAFSPDGKTVVTAGLDGTAQAWDAVSGTRLDREFAAAGQVEALAFSRDGRTLVTAGTAGGAAVARLWDAGTGRLLRSLSAPGRFLAVAVSPDGRFVLTGGIDQTAQLWEAATGRRLGPPLRHGQPVNAVAFSPDGTLLLTSGPEPVARLRAVLPERAVATVLAHPQPVGLALFSPDGRRVVTATRALGKPGAVRVWDAASGRALGTPVVHADAVRTVALSPDGHMLLTGCADGTARLVPIGGGPALVLPHRGPVVAVAFRPDGAVVLTASQDRTVRRWDAATGGPIGPPLALDSPAFTAAFSPDGRLILAGDEDGGVRLWDAASGALLHAVRHGGAVVAVAFRPDGKRFLTASYDRTARVWDTETAAPVTEPLAHDDLVQTAAFSPDGRTIVTGSFDRTARLWDAVTGQPRGRPLTHDGPVYAVAFSPDGRTVATGSDDHTARLWDATTGRPLGPPLPHGGRVRGVVFAPDGRALLTAAEDGTARLWPVPAEVAGNAGRVETWVEVLTGMELGPSDAVHLLDAAEWQERRRRLADRGGAPLP